MSKIFFKILIGTILVFTIFLMGGRKIVLGNCAYRECVRCVDNQWGNCMDCPASGYSCSSAADPILCTNNCAGTFTSSGWKCCRILRCNCGTSSDPCWRGSTAYSNCTSLCNALGSGCASAPPPCSCTSWTNQGCGSGGCAYNRMHQTRTCSPSGCSTTSQCVTSSSCPTDTTAPVVSATNSSNNWFDEQRTAVVSATDTGGSGLAQVRYNWGSSSSLNSTCTSGGTVTSHGASLTAPSGGTTLYLCARDGAGNVGTWNGNYRWCTPSIPLNPSSINMRSTRNTGGNIIWQKQLSLDSGEPTILPLLHKDATGSVYVPLQASQPSCTSDFGYSYSGSGGLGEYSHSNYLHAFIPQSDLWTGGSTGSLTGWYYTVSMAGTRLDSDEPKTGYYIVNHIPGPRCETDPSLLPDDPDCDEPTYPDISGCPSIDISDNTSSRGCTSDSYTGIEINNPLMFTVKGVDKDGNDKIRGAIIWLSKEGSSNDIPNEGYVLSPGSYNGSNPDHLGVMVMKDGDSWDSPYTYVLNDSLQWARSDEIRNTNGQTIAQVIGVDVVETLEKVIFKLGLDFEEVMDGSWNGPFAGGKYEINSIVFDNIMLDGSIIDQYYMLKNCRNGGWNIDLRNPVLPEGVFEGTTKNPRQTGSLARQLDLEWYLDGTGSGVTNAVINAYSDSTGEDLVLYNPVLAGQSNTISLNSQPSSINDVGHFNDSNSWRMTNSSLSSIYEDSATIGIGENEKGMITFYVTGFDQACNDTLGSETINLNPWITAKGGLVYSGGSVGVNVKDVEGQWDALRDMLTRVEPEELDIATELVSSRDDYIKDLIRPLAGAVKAHSVFNSNSRTTWFEYLKGKLEMYKGGLNGFSQASLTEVQTLSGIPECQGKPCYYLSEQEGETVNIPENFECDGKALIMVDGNIHIEPDIWNGSTKRTEVVTGTNRYYTYEDKADNSIEGCIFVASGDITIGAGDWKTGNAEGYEKIRYDYIEAFMVAGNKIDIQLVDVFYPNTNDRIFMRDGLEIHGGLVAFGNNLNSGESAVQVNRSLVLFNNFLPTVVTSWDPRYAKLSEIFFGTSAAMYKREVGFKPY